MNNDHPLGKYQIRGQARSDKHFARAAVRMYS